MKKIKNYIQFIKENTMFHCLKELKLKMYNDMIDYTLLEESATDQDIIELCEKANMLSVKSVCVLPKHVALAAKQLENSKVLVCTVVSFPNGTDSSSQKLDETKKVISDGADEVDMVLNYKLLKELYAKELDINKPGIPLVTIEKEGEDKWNETINQLTFDDVSPLVEECHSNTNKDGEPIILKVIVESGLLSDYETEEATHICMEAGADFIKTSTGKVPVGAEMNKIKIMYDTIKEYESDMKIKASGGVRTAEQINSMLGIVDRFGMGYAAVDKLNNLTVDNTSSY